MQCSVTSAAEAQTAAAATSTAAATATVTTLATATTMMTTDANRCLLLVCGKKDKACSNP